MTVFSTSAKINVILLCRVGWAVSIPMFNFIMVHQISLLWWLISFAIDYNINRRRNSKIIIFICLVTQTFKWNVEFFKKHFQRVLKESECGQIQLLSVRSEIENCGDIFHDILMIGSIEILKLQTREPNLSLFRYLQIRVFLFSWINHRTIDILVVRFSVFCAFIFVMDELWLTPLVGHYNRAVGIFYTKTSGVDHHTWCGSHCSFTNRLF